MTTTTKTTMTTSATTTTTTHTTTATSTTTRSGACLLASTEQQGLWSSTIELCIGIAEAAKASANTPALKTDLVHPEARPLNTKLAK